MAAGLLVRHSSQARKIQPYRQKFLQKITEKKGRSIYKKRMMEFILFL